MLVAEKYRKAMYDKLSELDSFIALELENNKDIIKESIIVVIKREDGKTDPHGDIVGVGYLIKAASCYCPADYKGIRYIHASFKGFFEYEAEASDILIDRLIYDFRRNYKGYKLRLWCRAKNILYLDYLLGKGFLVEDTMLVLERELKDEIDKKCTLNSIVNFGCYERDLDMDSYLQSNALGFGIADSRYDMLYRLDFCKARVYTAEEEGDIVAAITVWPLTYGTERRKYATENIFCIPSKRRRGITYSLLNHVLEEVAKEGAALASLNVYGNNSEAINLYFKSGYEVVDVLLELHLNF
ncbi:MAG: GNAT family N-acetyltransferase [Lachnospiraceae bacterium]|nr:GNAT family N-acetyltransferase [Lachnospiraceae bacterium]